MNIKCTCGRRTPFAHNHAETCPWFHPQLIGRAPRIVLPEADYASDFAEAFQLVFEGYNRPADNFENDTAWATWQHGQLRKAFTIMQRLRSKQSEPTDELGKVWDVLHAAGINSVSASEGVKLLADKAKWAVPPFPQPKTMEEFIGLHMNKEVPLDPSLITGNGCDHDWFAPYGQKSQQCRKCDAVRG